MTGDALRLGIFGGSFDPPHRAHVAAILWALQSGEVDRVLVVPAARHAFGKAHRAPFADRVAMCRLAVCEFAQGLVEVLDIEGQRGGVSYTVDTVRALAAMRPGATFRLIVGSDIVADLAQWHESAALLALAPPLVVPRIVEGAPDERLGLRPGALPMLSSTTVRTRAARGESITDLVPHRVADYMRRHGLYAAERDAP
jgi:nicotinate-nucleotide adenylyltransferase